MNAKSFSRSPAEALLLLLMLGVALGPAEAAQARASFIVNTRGDAVDANPGDGLCADASGACTLRAAIQETNALAGDDSITLPAGTYILTIAGADEDAAATGDLDITDNLRLLGRGAGSSRVDGNGHVTGDRVFHILDSAVVAFRSVTISHGSAPNGGGIHNRGSLTLKATRLYGNATSGDYLNSRGGIYNAGTLTVSLSLFEGNTAETDGQGGGIYNSGALTVSRSTFAGNSATYGGGGIHNSYGTLTVSRSTLSGNSATQGGGIINYGGTVTVSQSALSGNSASGIAYGDGGGGIYNYSGALTVTHSTLSGNSATYGGGIYNSYGTLTVTHSTLSGNSATNGGGGVYNVNTTTVSHSTLSGNSATWGGGIFNYCCTLTLQGTLVADNTVSDSGPDCIGIVASTGYNLIGNNGDCTFNATIGDQVGTEEDPIDPLLGPLQDNGGPTFTHALLEGSPAIDTGTPTDCPATDQRGFPRPVDGDGDGEATCDIGAYEYGVGP